MKDLLAYLNLDELRANNYHGLGFTVNEKYAGFILNMPLVPGPLGNPFGNIKIQCTTDHSDFDCEVGFDGISRFGKVVVEWINGVAFYLLKECEEGFKTVGRTLNFSIERGNAKAKEVFSEENVGAFFKDILTDGKWDNIDKDLKEIAAVGYAYLALCDPEGEGCWSDGMACAGDPSGIKKKIGTCCNCCNDETLWKGSIDIGDKGLKLPFGGVACGTEPKWYGFLSA